MKKTWDISVNGMNHRVELEHGYISGKRVIYVDGEKVAEDRKIVDHGSTHWFTIDGESFQVSIKPKGFKFQYDLESIAEDDSDEEPMDIKAYERLERDKAIKSGASWFYWIAGLSIINTVLLYFESDLNFVIGLQLSQFVDAIAWELGDSTIYAIAFAFNLLYAGLFVFFGVMASRKKKWAFITGTAIYILDGLLALIIFDFISLAFHGFAVYSIYTGFRALKKESAETL